MRFWAHNGWKILAYLQLERRLTTNQPLHCVHKASSEYNGKDQESYSFFLGGHEIIVLRGTGFGPRRPESPVRAGKRGWFRVSSNNRQCIGYGCPWQQRGYGLSIVRTDPFSAKWWCDSTSS